jgi:hypothetical protein
MQQTSIVSKVADVGELAARIGSPVTYDRSGNVIWYTSFEEGLGSILKQTGGTGAAVDLFFGMSLRGSFSARLTGGSDGNQDAGCLRRIRPIGLTTYGLEATFSMGSDIEDFQIGFQRNTGSILQYWRVRFYLAGDEIQLVNSSFAYEKIADYADWSEDADLWHTAKLVADPTAGKYIKLHFNDQVYDLSDYPCREVANTGDARIELLASANSISGSNGIAYLDDMIATINEPT